VTAEIDVSDLEYEMYYIDQKCHELDRILQSDSKYTECKVKRIHWRDDGTDPFTVLDQNEESIVLLETWEVNTLNASDILLYIEVKQKRDRPLSDRDAALYGSSIALGLSAGLFAFLLIFEEAVMNLAFIIIPIFILTPILGIFSIRTYRKSTHEKKNADLDAVRSDSSFLDILRRLSGSPEVDKYSKKRFAKRIEYIEGMLTGTYSTE